MPIAPAVPVFLRDCLLEGDSAQQQRVRRQKQRALLVSVVLQIIMVIALVLCPLFSKGANISGRAMFVPTVPYSPGSPQRPGDTQVHRLRAQVTVCRCGAPRTIPRLIPTRVASTPGDDLMSDGPVIPGVPGNSVIPGLVSSTDSSHQPPPPDQPHTTKLLRLSQPVIEARLVRRIEPAYPPLAVQLRREGRVELHAIISTDGSIRSLEVIHGDPLFIQSALAAVRQWRYQPTILDDQAVEVDTHITVIYTLTH